MTSEASTSPRQWGYILIMVLVPIQDVTKGSYDAWLGMVGVDQGGLKNLAEWG